jgi:hypothetical protein
MGVKSHPIKIKKKISVLQMPYAPKWEENRKERERGHV